MGARFLLGLDQALSPRGGDSGVVVADVVVVATLVGGNAAPEKKIGYDS